MKVKSVVISSIFKNNSKDVYLREEIINKN